MIRRILSCAAGLALLAGRTGSLQAQAAAAVDTSIALPQEILTIAPGQTRSGRLEPGDWVMGDGTYADVWYFNAAAGQQVTIELRSSQFDAYVQLLDPYGARLGHADDGLPNRGARLVFTIREAGRYQIVVNNFGDEPQTGVYQLSLR